MPFLEIMKGFVTNTDELWNTQKRKSVLGQDKKGWWHILVGMAYFTFHLFLRIVHPEIHPTTFVANIEEENIILNGCRPWRAIRISWILSLSAENAAFQENVDLAEHISDPSQPSHQHQQRGRQPHSITVKTFTSANQQSTVTVIFVILEIYPLLNATGVSV